MIYVVEILRFKGLYPFDKVWEPYARVFFHTSEEAEKYMLRSQGYHPKNDFRVLEYAAMSDLSVTVD